MKDDVPVSIVRDIMAEFAARTGLDPAGSAPRRYLWTDAFAVCNFLELFRTTGDDGYRELALRLVGQVHHTLGRHRADDPRTGWISGLGEEEGERHPTAGGLRIGKELGERRPGEPPDERREWDRDGQYYHYLTKWMHALNRVSRVTGDAACARWASELAQTAHARFGHVPTWGGARRLYWKMSIDLTRPLVSSMGQHDPLDGFVTYSELSATADENFAGSPLPDLRAGIADLAALCRGMEWSTEDPLGIGGLLADAWRMAQLTARGAFRESWLLERVVDAALFGLESFAGQLSLRLPAEHRLAFRELGLSIGLKAAAKLAGWLGDNPGTFGRDDPLLRRVEELIAYASLGEGIEQFWLEGSNREADSWREHREINMVMLATSLAPEGFLSI